MFLLVAVLVLTTFVCFEFACFGYLIWSFRFDLFDCFRLPLLITLGVGLLAVGLRVDLDFVWWCWLDLFVSLWFCE